MWTTDISGEDGYNDGDTSKGDEDGHYYKWFGGTSAATPEVAGLAGLILSVNPELTANEVQFIIQSTADDKGDPGRDDYYGWGRINNESALLEAVEFPTDDTLVGWWKFDDGSGQTASDSSGYGSHGQLGSTPDPDENDPAWFDDLDHGWCLDFDVDPGAEDYVSLPAIGALVTDNVTISAWIKRDSIGPGSGYHPIVSTLYYEDPDYYGYRLYVMNDMPRFYLAGYMAESIDSISTVDWYHLVGTCDGSNLRIYVNGELKGTSTSGGLTGFYENYNNTYIGRDVPTSSYFDGKIDDVRVYNYALSSRFRIKNGSGDPVAWFDSFGNLFLAWKLYQESSHPATGHDEFRFQDSNGDDVAIIDTTDGKMYIDGTLKLDSQGNWVAPTDGDDNFRIKDRSGNDVAYISKTGDLYLNGGLYEQNP